MLISVVLFAICVYISANATEMMMDNAPAGTAKSGTPLSGEAKEENAK